MDTPDPHSPEAIPDPPPAPEPSFRSSAAGLERHFTMVGALHVALSSMALLGGLIALGLFWGAAMVARDEEAAPVLVFFGCLAGGFLVLLSLPGIVGGIGLLKRRRWSRILLIVVGGLHLINVPLGTLLGVYTLWVLLQPEAEAALIQAGEAGMG